MDNLPKIFATEEIQLHSRILDFLEALCRQYEQPGRVEQESTHEALILNLMKVTNDCRAILLLAQSGFYIQAGILARSTTDACNLMMHVDVERDNAIFAERWLQGRRVTHWMLIDSLKKIPLDIDSYRELRRQLDDLVHANYEGLKLYPTQLADPETLGNDAFQSLVFWKSLIIFYLITCLLAVQLIAPNLKQADDYLEILLQVYGRTSST
ncbi:MAG: hypothetical protein JXA14_03585 [Anaerolineae bacterium]|nr:hypothetical protein [Anaerolineae bacterium]